MKIPRNINITANQALAAAATITVPANLSRKYIIIESDDKAAQVGVPFLEVYGAGYPAGTPIRAYAMENGTAWRMTLETTSEITVKNVRPTTAISVNIVEVCY